MLSVVDNEKLGPISEQVRNDLTQVVAELAKS
jgi:hypothetical protein